MVCRAAICACLRRGDTRLPFPACTLRQMQPMSTRLHLPQRLDAVLLTVDLDFSSILDYPPANYGGIIVLRYKPQDELRVDRTLQHALSDLYRERFRGILVIVGPGRYRIRR